MPKAKPKKDEEEKRIRVIEDIISRAHAESKNYIYTNSDW